MHRGVCKYGKCLRTLTDINTATELDPRELGISLLDIC